MTGNPYASPVNEQPRTARARRADRSEWSALLLAEAEAIHADRAEAHLLDDLEQRVARGEVIAMPAVTGLLRHLGITGTAYRPAARCASCDRPLADGRCPALAVSFVPSPYPTPEVTP